MDCKEVQHLIELFDKSMIKSETEEKFVNHICQCEECKDELEVYYLIEYGLKDDDELPDAKYAQYYNKLDFKGLLEARIVESRKRINKYNLMKRLWIGSMLVADTIMIAAFIIFIGIIF